MQAAAGFSIDSVSAGSRYGRICDFDIDYRLLGLRWRCGGEDKGISS